MEILTQLRQILWSTIYMNIKLLAFVIAPITFGANAGEVHGGSARKVQESQKVKSPSELISGLKAALGRNDVNFDIQKYFEEQGFSDLGGGLGSMPESMLRPSENFIQSGTHQFCSAQVLDRFASQHANFDREKLDIKQEGFSKLEWDIYEKMIAAYEPLYAEIEKDGTVLHAQFVQFYASKAPSPRGEDSYDLQFAAKNEFLRPRIDKAQKPIIDAFEKDHPGVLASLLRKQKSNEKSIRDLENMTNTDCVTISDKIVQTKSSTQRTLTWVETHERKTPIAVLMKWAK